ncbi:MAG: hypothetical protein Q7T03_02945 [Deltaproteobacteria bacterium]|nr:hypothetical protein [Deltaproteobacteria bacterium]
MTGVIQGGQEFVVAGYALTWIVLAGYAISLFIRIKQCKKESA